MKSTGLAAIVESERIDESCYWYGMHRETKEGGGWCGSCHLHIVYAFLVVCGADTYILYI